MRFRPTDGDEPEINLVPLIDVLLVVLIFLAISTTYAKFSSLKVALPRQASAEQVVQPKEVHLAVSADGRFAINGQVVGAAAPAELTAALQTLSPQDDTVLVIDADASAVHRTVVSAMEAARAAGFSKMAFATQLTGAR